MTALIPADSPKAVRAAAFGRELERAVRTRGVAFRELERTLGVGHTSLDNYRRGLSLPKCEKAALMAEVLDWPRLAALVVEARTATCARHGCGRRFRNEGGSPKRYCGEPCRRIAENVRIASRRARQAGQTGSARSRSAEVRRLRSGLAIASDQLAIAVAAIAAMCAECEPEGRCRTPDCPLRAHSPLPLATREATRQVRTTLEVREASWSPERRRRQSETTSRYHAEGRMRPPSPAAHPANDPARREQWLANLRAGKARRAARVPA